MMPPSPKSPEPPKQPVTWTVMPLPGVAFQAWADGSIKISFSPDRAEEVLAHFKQMVSIMEQGAQMIKNPPKKCPGCRGLGQIVVKVDNERKQQVCPECKGSGMKGLLLPQQPLPVSPAKLMTRNVGHVPPAPILPHQTEVDPHLKNEAPKQEPALREVDVEDLAEYTD